MPQREHIPIDDYSSTPSHPPLVTSFGITLYLGVICLLTLIIGWFILPHLQQAMVDTGTPLPPITVGFVTVTQWLVRFPGVIVLMMVPVIIPRLIARFIHRTDDPDDVGRRTTIAYILITLLAGVVVAITIMSVFVPLVGLMESVGDGRSGK